MDDFKKFLKTFSYLTAWAVGASAGPIIAALSSLAPPPWPKQMASFAAVTDLVVLILVFQYCAKGTRAQANRSLFAAALLLFLAAFGYLFLFNTCTATTGLTGKRVATGFVYTPGMRLVIANSSTHNSAEILRWAENDPTRIWERWSINVVTETLSLLWVLWFGSLSAVIGLFVVFQRGRKVSSGRVRRT